MPSIYKSPSAKVEIMKLYEEKLASLKIRFKEIDVTTDFGRTRIIRAGNPQGKQVVLFHGINAGAPLTIEVLQDLGQYYEFIAIDTLGQANKSEEVVLSFKAGTYAKWAVQVLDKLDISSAAFIGISYGACILQRLIIAYPDRVDTCIFVVPSGLVNGHPWTSFVQLSLPLLRFLMTKKDRHLRSFLKAFVDEDDDFMFRLQKQLLLGLKMDFTRPPLINKWEIQQFQQPVYIMAVSDDIFFPGEQAIEKAKAIFPKLNGIHILKGTKHIPPKSKYPEIQTVIHQWLSV